MTESKQNMEERIKKSVTGNNEALFVFQEL
jgi:hypothetical protein